jgi:O-antigen/teichoic acid export membrane protein
MMAPAEHLSSSRAVVRSGLFNIAGFLASAVYMVMLVPLAKVFLGNEQYGLWTAVLAITGYIGLADLGLNTSFVTYLARFVAQGDLRSANRVITHGLLFYLLVAGVMVLISVAGYPYIFRLLRIQEADWSTARTALYLAVAVFAVTSVAGVYGSVLAAVQRMDAFNLQFVGMLVVKFAFTYGALKAGYGVGGLFMADLAATFLSIPAVVYLTLRSVPGLKLSWDGFDGVLMKSLLKFGLRLQVSRAADIVQMNFDKLLLTRFQGLAATAMYDFGSRPINRLRTLPVTAISSLIPAVSALDADDNAARIRAAVVRSMRYLVLIALPLFTLCIAFADRLITLWVGPGNGQAVLTMQGLSAGSFIAVTMSALSLVSLGKGEPQFQMRTTLVQAVLNMALSTILVLRFGFVGAVAGTTVSMIVGGLLFYGVYARRVMDAPFAFLGTILARPVIAVVPAIVAGLLVARLGDAAGAAGSAMTGLAALAFGSAAFLAAYAVALRFTGALTADDLGFLKHALPEAIVRWLPAGNNKRRSP